MSTSPSSSPKPKPERSFSLHKIRGALRRGSKGPGDTPNGSSPEASEGRPSIDTPPTPPANVTTTPGSPTPSGSQRKPSSLRRMSLDVVRPNRHGRSSSVSVVPPAADAASSNGAAAAPATNGTAAAGEHKEDFDPFSESHDDKSKPRGWRKTVKGALRRTASRLSTSSAHSAGKPPSIDKEGSSSGGDGAAAVVPPLASPPIVPAPVQQDSESTTEDVKAAPIVPEAAVDPKPVEGLEAPQQEVKEDEDKDATPPVPLEASTSLEWEHVDTAEAEQSHPAVEVTPSVEITPSVEPEDEDVAEAKSGLAPLQVSSRHLMPLRSEMAELSPIMESPLTAARDDAEVGMMIPIHEAATALHAPSIPAIEESYVEVPHLSEAAAAAEEADVANASYSTIPPSPSRSAPPAGAIVVDVSPATLKPSPSVPSGSNVAASPALNAIELGNGGVEASGEAKKDVANSSTPLLANRSASTSSANGQEASTATQPQSTVSALSFVSNTAWFVGACVVVGIGMVVGQVRSYRQVQRRSTSTLSSYLATVKRWLRLA